MKKLETKLVLNKHTVASLNNNEMSSVKGGFTYSLSLGYRCKNSKSLDAATQFECGQKTQALQQAKVSGD